MLREKMLKRVVSIFLIFSLVYANLNPAICGAISYAVDNNQETEEVVQAEESKKPMSIEITEFCKNNMLDEETEYAEKIILNLDYEESFKEVIVSDINSEQDIDTYYETTRINKAELIDAIGEDGSLKITYTELEPENEEAENIPEEVVEEPETEQEVEQEEIVEPETEVEEEVSSEEVIEEEVEEEKVEIIAENGEVIINKDTEADEEGYITIIYPENTVSMNITINTNTNKIEELEITNNKKIKTVENLEEINSLETSKNITVKGEEELLNSDETITTPIEYSKTVAELGIDKTQISTTVENKVNFTITMSTDKVIYDLYKNPQFIIELPNEVKTVKVDNTIILNNNDFEVEAIEYGKLNGNQAILIKLKGEQTEYTNSVLENTQILVETTVVTKSLIPTLDREVKLHYQNENAKTYDGIGEQQTGLNIAKLALVSNKEIIVETKAVLGEKAYTSTRENYETVTLEPETYKTVQIIGTAINNNGEDIKNAKILGTATNIGEISGVEKVYYTANAEATADLTDLKNMWSEEYTANAKKYLIVIENFEQGETVTFSYNIALPENIEEDIEHIAKFEVYNDEDVKTSMITIYQEAKRLDIFEDETIKATIEFENNETVTMVDRIKSNIKITNLSGGKIEKAELKVLLPENATEIHSEAFVNNKEVKVLSKIKDNTITIKNINLEKDETITIYTYMSIKEYIAPSATIKANINYAEKQAEISNNIKVAKPASIKATITSNKLGKSLDEKEEIEYKITLKNVGESYTRVDMKLAELEQINIYSIKTVNLKTGETTQKSATDLRREINRLEINPGETIEITIKGIAKKLEQSQKAIMYAEIVGDKVETITTEKLTNNVSKAVVKEETAEGTNQDTNTIKGTAWVDKNEDGNQDKNEVVLKGIQATLINTTNLAEVATTVTNNNGEYEFSNIEEGNYVVEFKYNTSTFKVTNYNNQEEEKTLSSNAVSTTQSNETVVKTEVMTLENGITENVNIGLVVNKKFDLSINKGITKVTVDNAQGTNTYDFENSNMAKVEIDGEYFQGSLILVEYEISVTNIGEVAGYAKLIKDQIPTGMKFSSELNTAWYEGEDKTLYCEALANKELQPGETAVVKLVLVKEMTDDKITSPVNTVEIVETFNEYLIEDKEKENNKAEATIIISLTTGKTVTYIWLMLLVIAIIGTGTFGVIKLVNNKQGKE